MEIDMSSVPRSFRLPPSVPGLVAAALAASSAGAQTQMREQLGGTATEMLGFSVAGIGDVDFDGKPDFAVGAPGDDTMGTNRGAVRIFSGATGSLCGTLFGNSDEGMFGYSVANAGDVNFNGSPDLIIGAPNALEPGGSRTGMIQVVDVKIGQYLWSAYGDAAYDMFGYSVAGGIDANQDGYSDLLVGAPASDSNGADAGSVRAFDGRTGAIFTTFHGAEANEMFGIRVAVVGDATLDGYADFAIGACFAKWQTLSTGRVALYDGLSGAVLWNVFGNVDNSTMGSALAGGLDFNQDGRADVLVGLPGTAAGRVQVRSGLNGAVLFDKLGSGDDGYGNGVTVLDDLSGDGRKDFAVSAPQSSASGTGYVEVRSGSNGALLFRLLGEQGGEYFGNGLAKSGDVNGDGKCELLAGAPFHDVKAPYQAGAVRLFSGALLPAMSYCWGKTNSAGCTPVLGSTGLPHDLGSTPFWIQATNVVNQRPGTLIYGMNAAWTPFQGGTLCVASPVTRMPVVWSGGSASGNDCTGSLSFDFKARMDSGLDPRLEAGRTVYTQAWFRDGAASFGTGLSNALRFTIAP
jgi:hypothetical protein